jgi:sulfide dehydrogenase cytochrome subunit
MLLAAPAAVTADEGLSAYLASGCASCHQPNGGNQAIPPIVGWEEEDFIAAMRAFRSGEREDPAMHSVATSLSDAETAALADYFAKYRPAGKSQ